MGTVGMAVYNRIVVDLIPFNFCLLSYFTCFVFLPLGRNDALSNLEVNVIHLFIYLVSFLLKLPRLPP